MADDTQPIKSVEASLTKVEQELVKINPQVFSGLNPNKKQELIRTVLSVTKIHRGPLPDPETLQSYEDVSPGSAKMIMDTFQTQSMHRMELEKLVIISQQGQSKWGQNYAFIIAIFVLAGAFYCVINGHDAAGGVLGSVDLVGLVTVFILGKRYQSGNLEAKSPKVSRSQNHPVKKK